MKENTVRIIEIEPNLEETIRQEVAVYVEPIKSFQVVSDATMQKANDTIKEINMRMKTIDEKFAPAVNAAKEAKRKAEESRKVIEGLVEEIKAPLIQIKDYLVTEGKRYDTEQAAIREAEAARLREIARKEEEERRLREAEQAEKDGDHEAAQEIIDEELYVPAPPPPKPAYKADGRLFQKRWKGRGTDKMKAIRFIANNPQYQNLLIFDDSAINRLATITKAHSLIPGIDFYQE